jgi:hypothetical protein
MTDMSLARATARFLATLEAQQNEAGGLPVTLTTEEWEQATGVSVALQVRVRQTLMIAGLLRLSVQDGRWTYALAEGAL